jgi:hypothetical protein
MPTIDGRTTVWDVAEEWSIETGIMVLGVQQDAGIDEGHLSVLGEQIDPDDFLDGLIKPEGVVLLFMNASSVATLWELSPTTSYAWRRAGEIPGVLASVRLQ